MSHALHIVFVLHMLHRATVQRPELMQFYFDISSMKLYAPYLTVWIQCLGLGRACRVKDGGSFFFIYGFTAVTWTH